jgi:hypothetical protein
MKWLVFSKDRPYQLDAFLSTARDNAGISLSDISVLYKYSDDFVDCIETLASEHPGVDFISQRDFRNDVLSWLDNANANIISFATDDALFTRHVPFSLVNEILQSNPHVATVSLRMGLHLEQCYPTNSAQKVPNGQVQNGVFVWSTAGAEGDWSYPLSVDGHVFNRDIAKSMLELFEFDNPNSLESNWQLLKQSISPISCCLIKSCYFNVPLNRVQNEFKNRSGNVDPEELAILYKNGKRFSSQSCHSFMNISAHQEIEIT